MQVQVHVQRVWSTHRGGGEMMQPHRGPTCDEVSKCTPEPRAAQFVLAVVQDTLVLYTRMQEWLPSTPDLSYHTVHVESRQGEDMAAP